MDLQLFFALLRSVICSEALPEAYKQPLPEEQLKKLLDLAKEHSLLPLLSEALLRHGLLPAGETETLCQALLFQAISIYQQQTEALKHLCRLLNEASIPHLPLKGSVLRRYYPEPWLRTSCDIDVLIHKENAEEAIQLLCSAGYQRCEDASTHDYNFMSETGVHIELHYTLTQEGNRQLANRFLDNIWEYTLVSEKNEYEHVMENEMFLLYHLAHMGRHFVHGGCGIRPFIDLWLIEKNMLLDFEKLREILKKANLLPFYEAARRLISIWFGELAHDTMTKEIESFILYGGSYGTTDNAAVVKAAKGQSKLASFMKLMFLPRANLAVLYPVLHKHPYLSPLYQIKRWFRIFKKKNRNRIQHLTAVRNSVSQDRTQAIADLLQELELL